MFERIRPVADPVSFHLDGREIVAERGEPLAVSLLAAGEAVLARSPKLHRPRGPACLRGDCDGCIARVNGVPNVMTCLRPASGGEEVSVQNVLGSRKLDLLRITDWFFPKGIDHHHLMAGVPGLGNAMQAMARQMAGVGRLPDEPVSAAPAHRSTCDVLVVGGGLAGLATARALTGAGRSVTIVDEGRTLGGSALHADETRDAAIALAKEVSTRATTLLDSTVVGDYGGEVFIVEPSRAHVVRPKVLVIAAGAHDGVLCVSGNDLPGVMGARAVCALAGRGIVPREGAVVVGDGPWRRHVETILGDRRRATLAEKELASIAGTSRVKSVTTRDGKEIECGVVAVATPGAPSFPIGAQAGARTRPVDEGFALVVDDEGRAGPNLFAAGECTGTPFDAAALVASGERAARGVLSPR